MLSAQNGMRFNENAELFGEWGFSSTERREGLEGVPFTLKPHWRPYVDCSSYRSVLPQQRPGGKEEERDGDRNATCIPQRPGSSGLRGGVDGAVCTHNGPSVTVSRRGVSGSERTGVRKGSGGLAEALLSGCEWTDLILFSLLDHIRCRVFTTWVLLMTWWLTPWRIHQTPF